jgi:hypothetical protein
MDIVVTNTFNDALTVYYGDGTGAFPTSHNFSAQHPDGVAIGDVNGDGIPDLVATDGFTRQVAVLLGNGDGTFGRSMDYYMGSAQHGDGIVLADFTADGNLDVATANFDDNNVSVLLGNGDGSFQIGQAYRVGGYPMYLAAGDFNGDGFPDLVTVNFESDTVSVLLNAADWGGGSPAPRHDRGRPGGEQSMAGVLQEDSLSASSLDRDPQTLPQPIWTFTGSAQQSMPPEALAAASAGPTEPESPSMPTSTAIFRYASDSLLEGWVDPLVDALAMNSLR